MSTKALRNMKKRKRELEAELSQINEALKMLSQYEDSESDSAPSSGGSVPRPHAGPKPAEVMAEAKTLISQHGKPMKRAELYQALEASGFVFAGKNAINTLGVTLSRHSETFINLQGYGYWLREESYEPASYYPSESGESSNDDGESEVQYIQ